MKRDKTTGIGESKMRTIVRAQVRDSKVVTMHHDTCWVKVGDLREYTGWNFKKTDRMRKQGHVQYKRVGSEMLYDLYSVPLIFLIKPVLFHPLFLKQHA